MKRYKLIFMGLIVMVGLGSCKKYLDDVSENPNKPLKASPNALLPNIEVSTFANFTAGPARRTEILVQHMTGTSFQSLDITNYVILEGDVENEWTGIYAGALVNIKLMIDQYGDKNPYYKGMAKVLKAMNLGLATDLWGDVPNKEAGMGAENLMPKYDTQESVLADIQNILSEAIADLSAPVSANQFLPGADDYIYGGNPSKWIAAAWVLKARYANRLSKWSPTNSANEAINYLNKAYAAGFKSSAANMYAMFGATGQDQNQWQAFNQTRVDYIKMGKFFIDHLKTNNDPRLSFYADSLKGGVYTGADPANPSTAVSDMGDYVENTAKLPLVTYVEAKFIEAECMVRAGDNTGAAAAHNEAVKASILQVTGAPDPVYEALHASETSITITLNKVMMEKYVAMFGQIESFSDWRRTNIPGLTPNPKGNVGSIPRSFPTSQEERLYNVNATVNSNILNRVWWDK